MISRVFMLLCFLSILLQLARQTSKGYANAWYGPALRAEVVAITHDDSVDIRHTFASADTPPDTIPAVFCLGFFCRARRPAPFSRRPALLKKPKWRPALLTKKKSFFFFFYKKYQSHMAFSSVLPFLLPTHSVDCAVHLLLNHSRALLVSSALFHPFTALIMPFLFSSPR